MVRCGLGVAIPRIEDGSHRRAEDSRKDEEDSLDHSETVRIARSGRPLRDDEEPEHDDEAHSPREDLAE